MKEAINKAKRQRTMGEISANQKCLILIEIYVLILPCPFSKSEDLLNATIAFQIIEMHL